MALLPLGVTPATPGHLAYCYILLRLKNKMVRFGFFFLFVCFSAAGTYAHDEAELNHTTGYEMIDLETAKHMFTHSALFVDVRSDAEWDIERIANAVHLSWEDGMFNEIALSIFTQDKYSPIILYAGQPDSVALLDAAKQAVMDWQYQRVYVLSPGFAAWQRANYPVE